MAVCGKVILYHINVIRVYEIFDFVTRVLNHPLDDFKSDAKYFCNHTFLLKKKFIKHCNNINELFN